MLVASTGGADRVQGHPFGFGLQISSAVKFSGSSAVKFSRLLGLLGGILYLIMKHATDCYLAPVSVLRAALKEFSASF